ncbi:MAG TPA: GNAT family N-acetyltransferase [Polyangiaceae bacterium]|jgi:GNAT superfamily N-acetyltransferase|nr:GNAT family N-acetyltransferase [Polyangiaceae bacterium]
MKANVRPAETGDERVLASLNRFVHESHLKRRPEHFKATNIDELTEWFNSKLSDSSWHVWIAEERGEPIGYICAVAQEREESPFGVARRYMEIDQLVVAPRHRKRGVARALVRAVVGAALLRGIQDVELSSWAFNEEAHEAFRKLGFAPRVIRFGMDLQ